MDIEKLIELVRENPVLYVPSDPDYMRIKLKDDIWQKIGIELNSNGKTVKEKWLKLRECHREALRRQRKKKSGDATEPQKQWAYQQLMEYLLPFMKNRPTKSNMVDPLIEDSTVDNVDTEETQNVDLMNEDDDIVDQFEKPPPAKKQKNRSDVLLQQFVQNSEKRAKSRDEMMQMLFEKEKCHDAKDALFQFFMSMYTTAIGLPIKYQRKIRKEIFEVVTKAEEDHDSETSSLPSTPYLTSSSSYTPTPDTVNFQPNLKKEYPYLERNDNFF